MIKLQGITKVFGTGADQVLALDDIDVHIASGEIFGIIGFSGAGKSTLIRCINLLERPTKGWVEVDGQQLMELDPQQLRLARQNIGMIFQHFNLLSSRTVFDNVAFPLEIAGVDQSTIRCTVTEMLALVGLADKAKAYPAQLSGGQKQRVGIARALASHPKVLLCDEATSALDPQTTTSILKLLKEINQKLGLTIVLITHEMQVIREICDQVAVIEGGKIVEQGTVLSVFAQPQHPTTRDFVKTIMNHDLPEEIRSRHLLEVGENDQIIKVSFLGESTGQPVISDVIKKFDLDINILYGNVDHIQDTPFGILIIQITGNQEARQGAIGYLGDNDMTVEVLNYGQ